MTLQSDEAHFLFGIGRLSRNAGREKIRLAYLMMGCACGGRSIS